MTTTTLAPPSNHIQDPMSLSSQVAEAISGFSGAHLCDLQVTRENGVLTVRGTVDSFFAKQMVQESLRGFDGCYRIDNRLDVTSPAAV